MLLRLRDAKNIFSRFRARFGLGAPGRPVAGLWRVCCETSVFSVADPLNRTTGTILFFDYQNSKALSVPEAQMSNDWIEMNALLKIPSMANHEWERIEKNLVFA